MNERDVARTQHFQDVTDEQMKAIKAPAFITIGDKDFTTPKHAAEIHRLPIHSRLVIIPGGHGDYIGD